MSPASMPLLTPSHSVKTCHCCEVLFLPQVKTLWCKNQFEKGSSIFWSSIFIIFMFFEKVTISVFNTVFVMSFNSEWPLFLV